MQHKKESIFSCLTERWLLSSPFPFTLWQSLIITRVNKSNMHNHKLIFPLYLTDWRCSFPVWSFDHISITLWRKYYWLYYCVPSQVQQHVVLSGWNCNQKYFTQHAVCSFAERSHRLCLHPSTKFQGTGYIIFEPLSTTNWSSKIYRSLTWSPKVSFSKRPMKVCKVIQGKFRMVTTTILGF
jgi:hypothetical protein